jgi:uncharacterized membrane protein (UPF0127 family)
MFRKEMAGDHGMLFVFQTPEKVSFWMHNTLIPLDIIFLDGSGKVVDIHTRKALDETGMAPRSPALFVIELNAGAAKEVGLTVGDEVSLPEKYLKPGRDRNDK